MGRLRSRKAENLLDVASKSGTSDSRDVAYKHYAMTEPGWGGGSLWRRAGALQSLGTVSGMRAHSSSDSQRDQRQTSV